MRPLNVLTKGGLFCQSTRRKITAGLKLLQEPEMELYDIPAFYVEKL
jgi:hypothetical protein